MKNLTLFFFLASALILSGAIPPPIQSSQLTTNVPKPSGVQSVFVVTNATSGMGEWLLLSSLSGSVTNALSVIQKNGTTIASGVTNLDFVDGTNISISITNAPAGSVHFSANLNPLVWINASNFTFVVGQANSNLSYAIGLEATNYTDSRAVALSNLAYVIGANGTNFTYSIGANGTNFAYLIGANSTNFAYAIGANGTNFGYLIGANSTNFGYLIGANGTNFGYLIGLNSTNYTDIQLGAYVKNLSGNATNLTVRAPVGGPSLALTVETNVVVVTNGFVGVGTNAPTRKFNLVNDAATPLRVQRASSSSIAGTMEMYNMETTDGNAMTYDFLGDTTGAGASVGTAFGSLRSIMTTHDHATRAGDMLLMTLSSAGNTEKVRIKGSGNVGIGTNNPQTSLHVGNGGSLTVDSNLFISGPALSFSASASNGPAANEFPTAGWVRGLFQSGIQLYAATNEIAAATNVGSGQIMYSLIPTVPNYANRRHYPAVNVNDYIGSVMWTNLLQIMQGPITVSAYLEMTNGTGGPSVSVHPEIYYSYDKTNWLGDWDAANQSITTLTNLYQWVISFPTVVSTNAAGFYVQRRFRVGSATGATHPGVVFHVGTNYLSGTNNASHINLPAQTSVSTSSGSSVSISTNGVSIVAVATNLNIVTGSNTLVLATNTSGNVSIQINADSVGGGSGIATLNGLGTNTTFRNNGSSASIVVNTNALVVSNGITRVNFLEVLSQNSYFSFDLANVSVGYGLAYTPIAAGQYNSAFGNYAMQLTPGTGNSAFGALSLYNSTGDNNTAVGSSALYVSPGSENSAVGVDSIRASTGNQNTAMGRKAHFNTQGSYNSAFGYRAGEELIGSSNVMVGHFASSDSDGNFNTSVGPNARYGSASGGFNSALGMMALDHSFGSTNIGIGYQAMRFGGGVGSVAIGYLSLAATTNYESVAIGNLAGTYTTNGWRNVYLGANSGPGIAHGESNKLYIANASGVPLIGGDFSAKTVTLDAVLVFRTNTVTTPPVLDLGSFAFWNSNGLALWKCWNTNGSTVCAPLP